MLLPPQVQTGFKHSILSPKSSRMLFSTSEDVEFSPEDNSDSDISFIFSPLFFFLDTNYVIFLLRHLQTFFLNSYVQNFFSYATVTSEKKAQKWYLKLSKKGYALKYVMNNILAKRTCSVNSFCSKELIYRHYFFIFFTEPRTKFSLKKQTFLTPW